MSGAPGDAWVEHDDPDDEDVGDEADRPHTAEHSDLPVRRRVDADAHAEGEGEDDDRPHTSEREHDGDDDGDDEDLPDAFDGGDPDARPAGDAIALDAEFARDSGVSDAESALGCIRCGNSCRSVYLWQGDLALFKERDTKKWVEYHDLQTFTAKQTDGRTFWGVKLDKPCRYLITTDDGLHGCAIYDRRPYLCRIYKGVNPDGPQPGCGFNRELPGG